jgi:hypothetical protein
MANKYTIVIFSSSTFPRARKRDWSGVAESVQRMGVCTGTKQGKISLEPVRISPGDIPVTYPSVMVVVENEKPLPSLSGVTQAEFPAGSFHSNGFAAAGLSDRLHILSHWSYR